MNVNIHRWVVWRSQDSCASAWEHESGFTAAGRQAGWLGPNNNTKLHATPSNLQQNHPLPDARTHTLKVLPHEAHWRRRRNADKKECSCRRCVFPDSLEVSFLIAHLSSTLLRQGHTHSLQDPVSSAFWSHRNTVTVLVKIRLPRKSALNNPNFHLHFNLLVSLRASFLKALLNSRWLSFKDSFGKPSVPGGVFLSPFSRQNLPRDKEMDYALSSCFKDIWISLVLFGSMVLFGVDF